MANDNDSNLGAAICGLLLVAVGNLIVWGKFRSDLGFFNAQQPSMCVDGRDMGQPIFNATVGVDDTRRNKGTIHLDCSIPVAVHHCLDQGIDPQEWSGQCNNLATTAAFALNVAPRRESESGIQCGERDGWGIDRCSAQEWTCTTGKCTGYQKAMRICAGQLRPNPYKCFTLAGDPKDVREEYTGFPYGWLVFGILLALLAAACCCGSVVAMCSEENCVGNALALCCVWLCFTGVAFGVGAIVGAARGEKDRRGVVEAVYKELAAAGGMNETTVQLEPPPEEGMHWALVLLIVLGSMYGLGLLCFCGFFIKEMICGSDDTYDNMNEQEMQQDWE